MDKQTAKATAKAIWRYLDKVTYGSYPNYGWDWPTLRMLYPRIAEVLKASYRVMEA